MLDRWAPRGLGAGAQEQRQECQAQPPADVMAVFHTWTLAHVAGPATESTRPTALPLPSVTEELSCPFYFFLINTDLKGNMWLAATGLNGAALNVADSRF